MLISPMMYLNIESLFFFSLSFYLCMHFCLFIKKLTYRKFFYVCDSTKKDYLANNRSCICQNSMFDQIQNKNINVSISENL
jgi:hypothetical protein